MIKRIIAILLMITLGVVFVACEGKDNGDDTQPIDENGNQEQEDENQDENDNQEQEQENQEQNGEENPKVVITLWDDREIRLELYPDIAPITVNNFLQLVDSRYYTNTIFHRIIKNFMIQAGMLELDGQTLKYKPSQPSIEGEFDSNGHPNPLKHTLGVISMARATPPNSASAQFFICSGTSPHLDGDYAAFGKTIDQESNEVVLQLHAYPTYSYQGMDDFPIIGDGDLVLIKSIQRMD